MTTYTSNQLFTKEVWTRNMYLYGRNEKEKLKINPLNQYERKIHSQNGEDGIINEIFKRIGTTNKYYVEFGAADGSWMSNTKLLRLVFGWSGLLIESDIPENNPNINLIKTYLTPENINSVFSKHNVPDSFDLLSIDVDGNDFWLWKAITIYRPRVVIIESNPALPNNVPLTIPYSDIHDHYHGSNYFGANLRALVRLAHQKEYKFVTAVSNNLFFVLEEDYHKLGLPGISEDEAVQKYFRPDINWFFRKDPHNRVWINPFTIEKKP